METQSQEMSQVQESPQAQPQAEAPSTPSTQENSAQPQPQANSANKEPEPLKGLDRLKAWKADQAKKTPGETQQGVKETKAPHGLPVAVVPSQPAPPQAAYQPNFKFKVGNKEHEFDEFLRGSVKDPETEKKLKELYEKAYGLDIVKPRFQEARNEANHFKTEFTGLRKEVDQILAMKESDLGSFFKATGISKERLFQYVANELNYENLPPEQKQAVDGQRDQARKAQMLEQQYQQLSQNYQQQAVHARTVELSSVMSRGEVQTFRDAFDARYGNSGAFEAEVIKLGKQVYLESGQDLAADQAVKMVMDHYGKFLQSQPATQPQVAPQAGIQNAQATPAPAARPVKPPVIPAVQGRPTSPTVKSPRSIEDLKKIRKQLAENA